MVDAHPGTGRRPPYVDPAGLRQEAAVGVFGIEPDLDGVTGEPHLLLAERQALAARDPELPLDEVETGDRLGHRVLDLQPGVHFEKVEFAVGAEQELDRARAAIADRLGGSDRSGAHARPQAGVECGRRRFLDHLLVAALHRAVALAEVNDVAVAVGEHLDLDVARSITAFSSMQLGRRRRRCSASVRAVRIASSSSASCATRRMPRPPPPAAALTITGQADLARFADQGLIGLVIALVARHTGHAVRRDHANLRPRTCCPSHRSDGSGAR